MELRTAVEEPRLDRRGFFDPSGENSFHIRSLTPPSQAGTALAVGVRPSKAGSLGLLLLFLVYISLDGCGYHPATLSPSATKTPVYRIMIPVFFNDTFEPVLEGKVTRMVKQEFITHGGFRVVQNPAQAHLILEGRITSFGLTPLSFNQEYRVTEYRVSIAANVKVLEAQNKKLMWQNGVEAAAEFVVSPDPGASRSAQDLATDEAAKRVAEEIWVGVSRLELSEVNQ
jgi:outer membrane lipopolysaccharide assembly protein LptE/RlpB